MITDYNLPNEPSIIVNPANTQNIIVGENSSSYYVSNDGGFTWERKTITSNSGYGGDPSLDADMNGNIYFLHLSNTGGYSGWIDRIVCQKSDDNGNTFAQDSYMGYNSPKKQDKQWSVIDHFNHKMYVTWTQFDAYGSSDSDKFSNIMFSKSDDNGATWSNAIQINDVSGDCVDSDNTVEGATPAVGPNGEVYVSWVGPAGLMFDKSTDGGQTWLPQDIMINDMQNSGGWDYDIPGINRCNGLPITKCDLSNSSYRGTIYINWSDQRNGADNTDIFLSKSTDGGQTWSVPIKVNNDTGHKHQFLTWMDIDQTNGNLYFVFYDRRNYNDNNTDVYMAVSTDGGETFSNKRISANPFIPDGSHFFGDYTNLSAHNGVIRPAWTQMSTNSQSLWTAIVNHDDLLSMEKNTKNIVETNVYPVPNFDNISIKYKLINDTQLTINLLDNNGRLIKTLIDNQFRKAGKNKEVFKNDHIKLSAGIYFIELKTNDFRKLLKLIKD
jgi:hypothetical protein